MSNLTSIGLRFIMATTFILFFLLAIGVIGSAAIGEVEALEDVFEVTIAPDEQVQIAPWRVVLAGLCAGLYLYSLWLIFMSVHRLLKLAKRAEMASKTAALTLRRMGRGMVLLWIATIIVEGILPSILLSQMKPDIEWDVPIIGAECVYLICGAALWVVAALADEAYELKEEMSGVV